MYFFEELIVLEDETFAVSQLNDLIKSKKQELQAELDFISAQLGFLPESIVKLQGRNRLVDSLKLLDNFEKHLFSRIKEGWTSFLEKNPGLQKMREYFQVFSGSIFTLDNLPQSALQFQFAPIVSAEVERLFKERLCSRLKD